ncbi:ATP-binding protein [Streptomyces durbertensis]|uniref:ATP-binding protein n=1 Tax=Streptomyces durbertensis TaxID=2448886 RepID=A0ABR6EKB2_9ACTN|nr:ATP-binding protein [Streptomyces durbertensis]MBB1245756.1 ATP-binding protein [Streptomyces durbertensis]
MELAPMRQVQISAAESAPLKPLALALAERFRSITLIADSADTAHVARRTAGEVVHDWVLQVSRDDVELCVSELVGNAVHHATPDGQLTAFERERLIVVVFRAWSRWLFIEVTDQDSTPPILPVGDLLDHELSTVTTDDVLPEHGRGLFLVQSLASAVWWAPRDAGGKSVFCRFDLDDVTH